MQYRKKRYMSTTYSFRLNQTGNQITYDPAIRKINLKEVKKVMRVLIIIIRTMFS